MNTMERDLFSKKASDFTPEQQALWTIKQNLVRMRLLEEYRFLSDLSERGDDAEIKALKNHVKNRITWYLKTEMDHSVQNEPQQPKKQWKKKPAKRMDW